MKITIYKSWHFLYLLWLDQLIRKSRKSSDNLPLLYHIYPCLSYFDRSFQEVCQYKGTRNICIMSFIKYFENWFWYVLLTAVVGDKEVVSLVEGVVVLAAAVVVGPSVVVVQKPQVCWHSVFTWSHLFLSFLFWQVFAGSVSTHGT